VPLLTVDTSVALPAMLAPSSVPRKLWVVRAYGALVHRLQHLRVDRDALRELAAAERGELRRDSAIEQVIAQTEERHAALGALLPEGTPDDYVSVGFAALFDEYTRKLREVGRRLDPELGEEDVPAYRRQFEAICAAGPPPFGARNVPALTRGPTDDPIVYAALPAGCDFLVSDNKDIVPECDEVEYEHGERRLRAVRFGHFIRDCFVPEDFPLD
jgi:hypothetical protein